MMLEITIFVEMEKMNKIVSVVLLALMCCVSVFQCHHHDDAGHAFFLTYGDTEITITGHHGDCQHHHDCKGTHDDETSVCGMHLTEALTIGKTQSHVDDMVQWTYIVADCAIELSMPDRDVEEIIPDRNPEGMVTVGYSHTELLRGPPACV